MSYSHFSLLNSWASKLLPEASISRRPNTLPLPLQPHPEQCGRPIPDGWSPFFLLQPPLTPALPANPALRPPRPSPLRSPSAQPKPLGPRMPRGAAGAPTGVGEHAGQRAGCHLPAAGESAKWLRPPSIWASNSGAPESADPHCPLSPFFPQTLVLLGLRYLQTALEGLGGVIDGEGETQGYLFPGGLRDMLKAAWLQGAATRRPAPEEAPPEEAPPKEDLPEA